MIAQVIAKVLDITTSLIRGKDIRRKMLVTNLVSFAAATALGSAGWLTVEYRQYKQALVNNMNSQSAIISNNSTASLLFNDPKSAAETLSALKNSQNIEQAVVYDKQGKIFAEYQRPDFNEGKAPEHPDTEGFKFSGDHLLLLHPIIMDGDRVGSIYIRSDLQSFYTGLIKKLALVVVIGLFAYTLAFLLLSRLQKAITGPIFEILGVMERVSRDKKYAERAPVKSEDELGLLARGFNDMLEQVEFHQQNLEKAVASRTSELEAATKNLERALETEKRFLASVSHEMRTPLNSIIGFTDLLATSRLDAEQARFLKNARTSSQHLLSLICDILDVSKIDAGQMELRTQAQFSFKDLLSECMTIVTSGSPELVKPSIECPEMKFDVVGDDTRVKQIFLNLLSNAFKFTKEGSVRLIVDAPEEVGERVRIQARVIDTGIGIDADKIGALFAPFRQVHSGSYGGTGMGLFISRSLAQLMDGDIRVESTRGQGTTFFVTLTLSRAATKSAKPQQVDGTKTSKLALGHLRVLLVEDIELNVALATTVLSKFFGITPDVAGDGLQAVEMASKKTYDLIFMDIQMPRMDGITATGEIRKLGITTPIVAMTANALSGDIEKAKQAGVNDYVTKPIKRELLERVLTAIAAALPGDRVA